MVGRVDIGWVGSETERSFISEMGLGGSTGTNGQVDQPGRSLPSQGRSREFESRLVHHLLLFHQKATCASSESPHGSQYLHRFCCRIPIFRTFPAPFLGLRADSVSMPFLIPVISHQLCRCRESPLGTRASSPYCAFCHSGIPDTQPFNFCPYCGQTILVVPDLMGRRMFRLLHRAS